jgi:hypothetical protein
MDLPNAMNAKPGPNYPYVRDPANLARTRTDNNTPAAPVKYRLIEPLAHAPWHTSMRTHVGELIGTSDMSDLVLDPLTGSLAPTAYNNYGTKMLRFKVFCD